MFDQGIIKNVVLNGDWYDITMEDSWCFGLEKKYGIIS